MQYVLKKRIKWYSYNNYLELFDPKKGNIVKIEAPDIDKAWNNFLNFKDDNTQLTTKLIELLFENGYLEDMNA